MAAVRQTIGMPKTTTDKPRRSKAPVEDSVLATKLQADFDAASQGPRPTTSGGSVRSSQTAEYNRLMEGIDVEFHRTIDERTLAIVFDGYFAGLGETGQPDGMDFVRSLPELVRMRDDISATLRSESVATPRARSLANIMADDVSVLTEDGSGGRSEGSGLWRAFRNMFVSRE